MAVNKLVLVLSLTFCFACKHPKLPVDDGLSPDGTEINDSISYHVDVNGAEKNPQKFVVVKKIFLGNIEIGAYSQSNIKEAFRQKSKLNSLDDPTINFVIRRSRAEKWPVEWMIKEPINSEAKIELMQGAKLSIEGIESYYLKILRRENINLNCYAVNFEIRNDRWEVVSKERVITDSLYRKSMGYCIDYQNKMLNYSIDGQELPHNEINFLIFDQIPDVFWECN